MASPGAGLTHTQRVTRLYRHSLKHLLSWCIDRSLWRQEALKLRDRFDAAKSVNMPRASQLLEEGEQEFRINRHPEPYTCNIITKELLVIYILLSIVPTSPGGSKWERNIPPPPEVRSRDAM